jgi:magnesium transporter
MKIPNNIPLISTPLIKFSILNRKKKDPNEFIFTGESKVEEIDIQLFRFTKEMLTETERMKPEDIGSLSNDGQMDWLNIYGIHDTGAIASICKKLNIDSLTIQDILDVNQRPKFQEFEEYNFFTIKSILPSRYPEIESEQISFIMGKGFLVSFQEKRADYFDHIRTRLREGIGTVREKGSDYLMFVMLESILDNYFKTLQMLQKDIDQFNLIDTKTDPSPALLKTMELYRRHVSMIRKTLYPVREFAQIVERGENSFIELRHLKYYFELKDMCITLIESCETMEAEIVSHINLFFSVQNQRMSQIMKTLTIVATIFIPLTFIAGIYGMNFSNMPELDWRFGYIAVWGVFLLCVGGMLWYLRKKRWF